MHLSTHTWMRVEPLRRSLERAVGFGYSSVELTGEPDAHPVSETAKLLADTGLRCWGAGSVLRGERNLAAADAAAGRAPWTTCARSPGWWPSWTARS